MQRKPQLSSRRGVLSHTDTARLVNRIVYKWEASDRIAYRKDVAKVSGVGFLALGLALYLVWVGQALLALGVIAIFVFYYVIATVPPVKVLHRIETYGVRTLGRLYPWENLVRFWFAELDGHLVLYIDTTLDFPGRLFFLVDDPIKAQEILQVLGNFLPYKILTKKQTFLEKLLEGSYIPPEELLPIEEADLSGQLGTYLQQKRLASAQAHAPSKQIIAKKARKHKKAKSSKKLPAKKHA